jgi:hypothetical protein
VEKLTGSPTKPSDLWAIVCCCRGKSAFPTGLRPLRLCLDLTPGRAPGEHLVPITVRFQLRGRFQVWFGFAHSRRSLAIKMSSRQVRPDYRRASILMLSTARRGRPHRGDAPRSSDQATRRQPRSRSGCAETDRCPIAGARTVIPRSGASWGRSNARGCTRIELSSSRACPRVGREAKWSRLIKIPKRHVENGSFPPRCFRRIQP